MSIEFKSIANQPAINSTLVGLENECTEHTYPQRTGTLVLMQSRSPTLITILARQESIGKNIAVCKMRSARRLLSFAVAVLTLRGRVALGETVRRLRHVVEVSDLMMEGASGRKVQTARQLNEERLLAQEEIYRLLVAGGAQYSASMSTPGHSPPPKPLPHTHKPVGPLPKTPSPVGKAETDAPVSMGTDAPVATDSPVSVETPEPIASVTSAPVTAPLPSSTPSALIPPLSERDLLILQKCGVTADERSQSLAAIATDVFGEESAARSNALSWIDNEDPAILCPVTERITQRLTVAVIYFTMDGPNWTNCGNSSDSCVNTDDRITRTPIRWLSPDHECVWYGLFCVGVSEGTSPPVNETFSLSVIDLPDNNVGGTLPLEMFSLDLLQVLTMDGNGRIGGAIPPDIAKLASLTVIDLDNNVLTGTLPSELFTMTKLEAIDLNDNRLIGNLPSSVGNLLNLGVLQLENNQMTGVLPESGLLLLEKMGTTMS